MRSSLIGRRYVVFGIVLGVLLIAGGAWWAWISMRTPSKVATVVDPLSESRLTAPAVPAADIERRLAAPVLDAGPVRVPFTDLSGGEDQRGDVYLDVQTRRAQYRRANGMTLAFPFPGLPVNVVEFPDGRTAVAFREIFAGKLWLLWYDAAGKLLSTRVVNRPDVDYPLFRAAASDGESLYWVLYDNRTRKNYLRTFRLESGAWVVHGVDVELPSFGPPAGSTYEMEPKVFLHPRADRSVEIVAGNAYAHVETGRVLDTSVLGGCEAALEVIFPAGKIWALCRGAVGSEGQGPAYVIAAPTDTAPVQVDASLGVPWHLALDAGSSRPSVQYARTAQDMEAVFVRDIRENHFGGLLESGVDNTEGRVPWSQAYYLNGLLDAVMLARQDADAYEIYGDLLEDLRLRLAIEFRLLDDLLVSGSGLQTQAFTFDRSPALFAVQTGRMLLLLERYGQVFPQAAPLRSLGDLRSAVPALKGHIEVLARAGEDPKWMVPGTAHLRWPKGSAFYFDGLSVPFNHQDEWASAVLESARAVPDDHGDESAIEAAKEMLRFFLYRLGKEGGFPDVSGWYYWYGHAYDGYKASDGLSVHTPDYVGDHGLAWISFRTIDLMSVLSALDDLPDLDAEALRRSALARIQAGDVYPFAARSLFDARFIPPIRSSVLQRYQRANAPWELANSVWALPLSLGIYRASAGHGASGHP